MVNADCRSGRCGCAAVTEDRTVRQLVEFGQRENGSIVWDLDGPNYLVSPRWAAHLKARYTEPTKFVEEVAGWIVYRTHPHVDELADYSFARIKWLESEVAA